MFSCDGVCFKTKLYEYDECGTYFGGLLVDPLGYTFLGDYLILLPLFCYIRLLMYVPVWCNCGVYYEMCIGLLAERVELKCDIVLGNDCTCFLFKKFILKSTVIFSVSSLKFEI